MTRRTAKRTLNPFHWEPRTCIPSEMRKLYQKLDNTINIRLVPFLIMQKGRFRAPPFKLCLPGGRVRATMRSRACQLIPISTLCPVTINGLQVFGEQPLVDQIVHQTLGENDIRM